MPILLWLVGIPIPLIILILLLRWALVERDPLFTAAMFCPKPGESFPVPEERIARSMLGIGSS